MARNGLRERSPGTAAHRHTWLFCSIALCVLFNTNVWCQVVLRKHDILKINRGITVPFGRSVYIDPQNDLKINVLPGDRCVVSVLDNDPLSQRPGRVLPVDNFPCKFGPRDVYYSHFGARIPAEDRVRMIIRYDSHTETVIIPFTIQVTVSFQQLQIITKNLPLISQSLMGFSNALDRKNTGFTYDKTNQICQASVLTGASGLPRYGYIVNDTSLLSGVRCDRFLKMGITYKHSTKNNSPNKDYIPILVELLDQDRAIMSQEFFHKPVIIRSALQNTPPRPTFDAFLIMEVSKGNSVDQFVMTAIPPKVLAAEDIETPPDLLVFNITGPLGPGEGHIVSTDDRDKPLNSFLQKDVRELKIAYRPPETDSNSARTITVELQVIDMEGAKSAPFTLIIVVNPKNTMAPVVTINTGIQLFEGQSRQLLSFQNLRISDEDNLQDVKIFVEDGVRHGQLLLPPAREYFTPVDLDGGIVIYQHDGSDTYSDNVIFRMTDGEYHVEFLFPITIYPEDDEPPFITTNTGLEIYKNQLAEISQFKLSATDVDSEDSEIKFILDPPYSKEGVIMIRQFQIPRDLSKWQYANGVYEKMVDQFTQQDLMEGKVFYKHIGPHRSSYVTDKLKLSLSDANEPPNKSQQPYYFNVQILPLDDQPPYLHLNTHLKMTVEEFQLTTIKRKYLRYTDDDTNDRKLRYRVTTPPFDTDPNTPLTAGHLVLCEDPGAQISGFSQAQINHHKICYQPPTNELGIIPRIIQFRFSVTDVNGNVLPDQTFTISLKPMDNKPPIITNTGTAVFENSVVTITPQLLDAHDPDTDNSNIRFIISMLPEHGIIKKQEQPLVVGDQFTRRDLSLGNIVYVSLGEEVVRDSLYLEITDGAHVVPTTFRFHIKSVDDEAPVLVGLESDTLEINLDVKEQEAVVLESDYLRATDPDTDDMILTFMIERAPTQGILVNSGQQVDHFTQKDLIDGRISYKHLGGDIGRNSKIERFSLSLTDRSQNFMVKGNRVFHIEFLVTVLPVDNIVPTVLLGAPFEVLESGKEPILPRHLDSMDDDSLDKNLQCTIVQQPRYGYVEITSPAVGSEKSRVGIPVSAFYIKEVRLGNVNYVQSIHKGEEHRKDFFIFYCSDGINSSPNFNFNISIYPANDEEPVIFVREFVVMEGLELKIDVPILTAVDRDKPSEDLMFIITKSPQHGQILQQRSLAGTFPVTKFRMSDISPSSNIMYKHDDSETTQDSFEFIVTDGKFNITKSIPIAIIPVDDETPRLSVNNGLQLENIGDKALVSNMVLKAEDIDSPDPNITFIIRRMPAHGYLFKQEGNEEMKLKTEFRFTQLDIDNRVIFYQHTGLEGQRDLVKFDVTDGLNPLVDRYFYITVAGVDLIYPEVINRGVQLPEGGAVTLTTDIISGRDLNTPDEALVFTIINVPQHGFLEITDNPGVPILNFTQLDLAGNKIRYVHTSRSEIKMDRFEFEVTDGSNPVLRSFRVTLNDVDNKKPVLLFGTLHVKEGGNKIITPFELKAIDEDTQSINIRYTITQIPVHGNILYGFRKIVTTFTQEDLKQNKISYQHDGTDTLTDGFSFTVTDGKHNEFYIYSDTNNPTRHPQTMTIDIVPVDNGVPQISINKGATSLVPLPGGRPRFVISDKVLRCDDRDSPSEELKFYLTIPPKYGQIIHTDRPLKNISTWTQADLDNQKIQYILLEGTNVTSDSFFFKVADKGGNELLNQPFHLTWCWIAFSSDNYIVNETQNIFEITLHRRGYLGETTFVTIRAENGSARVGEDIQDWFAPQVQFNPGQKLKTWRIHLNDDDRYEGFEQLRFHISEPVMALLEHPLVTMVTIQDMEDESVVAFPETEYRIAENVGEVLLPVHRTGDLTDELMVICTTVSGSAKGTQNGEVLSGSDYISRADDHHNIIRFDYGQSQRYCRIQIIDDSLYEDEETFVVKLMEPMGGRIGGVAETSVVIEPDPEDEPVFHFQHSAYTVDESARELQVMVWRTGSDLSRPASVTVRSRRTDPKAAEAGLDYIAVNRILDFPPGTTQNTLTIRVLDDLGQPSLEGPEAFIVVLRLPHGATLGEPHSAVVTIDDSVSDRPITEFKDKHYLGYERDGQVTATIVRRGDISHASQVRCYTRQASAAVEADYRERPDTDQSLISFMPGEREKPCTVDIVDDSLYEQEEVFRLVLGSARSPSAGGAEIGRQNSTMIKIFDREDKPRIGFERQHFTVNEPIFKGDISTLIIPVIRSGDLSGVSEVRVHTKDGSARAGRDFNGFSKVLVFGKGVARNDLRVQVLYDNYRENREVFTIHLRPDRNGIAEVIRNNRAVVYIEENKKMADVVFPTKPVVVSLRDYDQPMSATVNPVHGYPVVCITPCNPKHPEFDKTGKLCTSQEIDDSLTKFRWKVAPPAGPDGVIKPLTDIETSTFFASTRGITLDSIYFNRGCRVQCLARAVTVEGDPGREQPSQPVTISLDHGLCPARDPESVGSEPFTARLRYLGPSDRSHPNKVKVSVTIPHRDGMLPVISTRQLSNFEFILSPNALRIAQHKCSNLLDIDDFDVSSGFGFVSNGTKHPKSVGEMEPYQYSKDMRGERTLRFYRNLNLEACLWEFHGYFDMSELVSICGGEITTQEGQAINLAQSQVTIHVPFYVSYIFHTPEGVGGWRDINMETDLQLSFVYDTAILWQNGITSLETAPNKGSLFPTSVRVQEDKRLVVTFKSEPHFRGQFVPSNPGTGDISKVVSPDHPEMTFTLNLIRSDPTFEQPEQLWQFESDFAVKDYSGMYHVHLVPCTTTPGQSYSIPVVCDSQDMVRFELPLRFQQISDPVPSTFSLNTDFRLVNKRSLWLAPSRIGKVRQSDSNFSPGDKIFGRIDVDPLQNLGEDFGLGVEKVFLCSGKDGYIPKYDPQAGEYGCASDSPKLLHSFKILDRKAMHTVDKSFNSIPFNAMLAQDDPGAADLLKQPGADGFSVDTQPLFEVDTGRIWFLHAVYSMRSNQLSAKSKRSATYIHSISSDVMSGYNPLRKDLLTSRSRRAVEDVEGVGQSGKGTNMVRIVFAELPENDGNSGTYELSENEGRYDSIVPILVGICILLFVCLMLLVIFIRRRRKRSSPPPSPTNTITVVSKDGTASIVHISPTHPSNNKSDPGQTEV